MPEIAAIVLAAGQSSRFGADKLLAETSQDGRRLPLLAHTILRWLEACEAVHVVIRPEADGLMQAMETSLPTSKGRIRWLVCEDAERGMGLSLAAGVAATREARGWLIGLGDMPALPVAMIGQVRQALEEGALLAAPYVQARRGHPVGIASVYLTELLALENDRGARDLLLRENEQIRRLHTNDAGVLIDIDTPSDLLTLNNKGTLP